MPRITRVTHKDAFILIHRIIGSMYGIFTYIYHKNQPNVGEYTSPMDPMGNKSPTRFCSSQDLSG